DDGGARRRGRSERTRHATGCRPARGRGPAASSPRSGGRGPPGRGAPCAGSAGRNRVVARADARAARRPSAASSADTRHPGGAWGELEAVLLGVPPALYVAPARAGGRSLTDYLDGLRRGDERMVEQVGAAAGAS